MTTRFLLLSLFLFLLTPQAAQARKPLLPPDPPPPHAELAHKVPDLEASLEANAAYQEAWRQGTGEELGLLLSAVSQLLTEAAFSGAVMEQLNQGYGGLKQAAIKLFLIHARISRAMQSRTSRRSPRGLS